MSIDKSSDAVVCSVDGASSTPLTAAFRLDDDKQDQEEYERINAVTILHHQIRQGLYSNAQRHAVEHPEAVFSPNSLGWTALHCSAASSQQMVPENHRLWWIWLLQQAAGRAKIVNEEGPNVSESFCSKSYSRHPLFETNIKGETPIDLFFAHWIHPHKWTSHDQHLAAAELRRVMHTICSVLTTKADANNTNSNQVQSSVSTATHPSELDFLPQPCGEAEVSKILFCCAFCNQQFKNPMLRYNIDERSEIADQVRRVIRRELDDWKQDPSVQMEMRLNCEYSASSINLLHQEWPVAEAGSGNDDSADDNNSSLRLTIENSLHANGATNSSLTIRKNLGTVDKSSLERRDSQPKAVPGPPRDRCIRSWFRRVTYFSKLSSFWQYMELLLMVAHHGKFLMSSLGMDEWSILHAVARSGCPKEVSEFIVCLYPEQCLLKDRVGNMPLHVAMKESTPYSSFAREFIETLVGRNASLASCPDADGRYPLHLGLLNGRLWTDGIKEIFFAAPSILYGGVRDNPSGLKPFMAAAVSGIDQRTGSSENREKNSVHAFEIRVRFSAITQESAKGMWTFLNNDIQKRAMQSARTKLDLTKLETIYQLLRMQPDALTLERISSESLYNQ